MKTFSNLLLACTGTLFLFFSLPTVAQYGQIGCLSIDMDKKQGYYRRNCERHAKEGNYLAAANHAALWLNKATKRKQVEKAVDRLAFYGIKALDETRMQLQELQSRSMIVVDESAITHREKIVCLYGDLMQLRNHYYQIPAQKKRSRDGRDVSLDIEDYTEAYQAAKDSLHSAKRQVADLLYERAKSLPRTELRKDNLRIARGCLRALKYNSSHLYAKELLTEIRHKATGYVVVQTVRNFSDIPEVSENNIRNSSFAQLESQLSGSTNGFFQTVALGNTLLGNITLDIEIRQGEVTRTASEPRVSSKSREVGKDNKKRTVTASFSKYNQTTEGFIQGAYYLRDKQTNEILISGEVRGPYTKIQHWATVKGNQEALSRSEKDQLRARPEWPSRREVFEEAGKNLAQKVANAVNEFLSRESPSTRYVRVSN